VGAALALAVVGGRKPPPSEYGPVTQTVVAKQAMAAVGRAVAHVRLRETDYRLNPANPVVRPAGVIEFFVQNQGIVTHALAIKTPHGTVRSDNLSPNATARLKVDLAPGRYTWYCPVDAHKAKGMSGTIRVLQPAPKPTTTPQPVTQTVIRTTTVRLPPRTVTMTRTRTVTRTVTRRAP
jgi:plastocyanin